MIASDLGPAATSDFKLRLLCQSCWGICSSRSGFRCDGCDHTVAAREGSPSFTSSSEFYEHQCTNTLKLPLVDRVHCVEVVRLCRFPVQRETSAEPVLPPRGGQAAPEDGRARRRVRWRDGDLLPAGRRRGFEQFAERIQTGPRGIFRMCSRGSVGWAAIPRRKLRLHRCDRRHRALR